MTASGRPDELQEIAFWSGGLECAADLYLQPSTGPHPSLVLGSGWNQTKESLIHESRYLFNAGYNVMTIDYRTLGKSAGAPRGQIYPRRQVEDLRNAITYLGRRPEVDAKRIGLYGVSFGGGVALQTAAFDRRVRACVAQSPITNGRKWMRELRNAYEYNVLLNELEEDFANSYGSNPAGGKAVNFAGKSAVFVQPEIRAETPPYNPDNPNPCSYPLHCQPSFNDQVYFESVRRAIDFNPSDVVDMIAPRPLLILCNAGGPYDPLHPPELIQELYAMAGEPKEMAFLPYNAHGLYQEPGRGEAMAAAIAFYDKHLK